MIGPFDILPMTDTQLLCLELLGGWLVAIVLIATVHHLAVRRNRD